jgi:hypothetical protein
MATPAELMEVIAGSLGLPVATVVGFDRHLTDAGLRTKVGRGRSVAQVTARDAAHLLTAILGGGQVKDAAETVRRYRRTEPHHATSSRGGFGKSGVAELMALAVHHSFVDALEALIVALTREDDSKGAAITGRSMKGPMRSWSIEVAALTPGTVGDIRITNANGRTTNVRYALPYPFTGRSRKDVSRRELETWQARISVQPQSDLEQFRKVSSRTISSIASLLVKSRTSAMSRSSS